MAITLTPPTTSQPTTTEPALQALPMTHVAGPAALDIEHLSKKFEGRRAKTNLIEGR